MSQTFKNIVDKHILFEFLESICDKTDKYYIFNMASYKRAELNNSIQIFIDNIKPYYHKAKLFYIERQLNYSRLCTIIRQICKSNSIIFSTKIIYSKSKYNIPYYIYV